MPLDKHRYTIPPTVVSTQIGEDTLVHDMMTQQFFRLNDVGTRIWELIDNGNTVDLIVAALSAEYKLPDGLPPSQLLDDVRMALSALRGRGLVVMSPSE